VAAGFRYQAEQSRQECPVCPVQVRAAWLLPVQDGELVAQEQDLCGLPCFLAPGQPQAESDPLGRFITQRCLTGPHFHVGSSELFTAWSKWCADEGEDPGTHTAFALALTNRGYDNKSKDRAGRKRWTGIGLADADPT